MKRIFHTALGLVAAGLFFTTSTEVIQTTIGHTESNTVAFSATKKSVTKRHHAILKKLVKYTNAESAGPNQNYYFTHGKAKLSGFANMKAGDYHFANDKRQRATTAKAVLTYSQYKDSQGSRQGEPLDPTAWPDSNPEIGITFGLTGRTYHGYLWNRSHSIADSLLGKYSYTSSNNFTTGTRSQNVGADQNGGMRAAEELVENYWESHPNAKNTVKYETTPLYHGSEMIPRGSIVDIKSTDKTLNTEIVVINSAEGVKIDYNTGANNAKPVVKATRHTTTQTSHTTTTNQTASPQQSGQWTIAAVGMVYVSASNKYYSQVTNPGNYTYETKDAAISSGAQQAARGNQYARP
jgi:DNA-entry nuclease